MSKRREAQALVRAFHAFEKAQAEIDAGGWWDGPPFFLEERATAAAEDLVAAVRDLCGMSTDETGE